LGDRDRLQFVHRRHGWTATGLETSEETGEDLAIAVGTSAVARNVWQLVGVQHALLACQGEQFALLVRSGGSEHIIPNR
jgi:hypothetical protein